MATISLRGVTKIYPNGFQAIHGVDLEIDDGELVVLVGPSGCGKSTLLRMVAGLETISSGEVHIDDILVNELEPADRNIAMVFQNYALYPHMSVFDNMAYGLRNRGIKKAEIQSRVDAAAGILELDAALLSRRPRQLSGGQRQRVAMGRAIVRKPKVFLFDEPLSNLDAKLRVNMRLEIKRLQRQLGTTLIYVTHDQVEAMTLADRLVVMRHGVPEQVGTPMELYDRPTTQFVAGFIGSPAMNFIPARRMPDDDAVELVDGGQRLRVPAGGIRPAEPQEVTLGIRPEHLTPGADDDPNALSLRVDIVESLGADTLVHGILAETKQRLTVRMPGKVTASAAQLLLHVPPDHVHLFDRANGTRIE